MASVSPPKPWERAGAAASATGSSLTTPSTPSSSSGPTMTASSTAPTTPASSSSSSSTAAPELPSRPSTLTSAAATAGSPYGTRLGSSPYSGMGGYNSMSSPYSRFGGMGGLGGGLGGMGSMYGGYGGGMYGGYGGYGGGMYGGVGGMPGDPNSLTQSFNQSTAATFQMLESIVGAFGGFAQMLESTYMATHSSFFAMVSVAEQFGNLKNTLGQLLGIYAIVRWIRTVFAKLTGRPLPADATALTPSAFAAFTNKSPVTLPDGSPASGGGTPKPSRKPFFFFIAAVIGLPYLMGKLVKALARKQERNQQEQQSMLVGMGAMPGTPTSAAQQIDPSRLDFCRVMYDYTPDPAVSTAGVDLAVKKGDLVAVLSRTDPMGNPSEWWKCRARDGSMGYLPSPYLETIQRKMLQQGGGGSTPSSRTGTMTAGAEDKANALTTEKEGKPAVQGKMGDISPESFQKSAFVH
ncbi:endoplasmic oxidoreductin-1 [Ascosphaera pollenicola]|nr:endoplasmic oxidoreductin-1 [Ascosphaera pollenicola]